MLGFGSLGAQALGQLPGERFIEPIKLVELRGFLPAQSAFSFAPPPQPPEPVPHRMTVEARVATQGDGFIGRRIMIQLSGNTSSP